MIGPITGSVAENEGFSTWSHTPEDTTAINRHWQRCRLSLARRRRRRRRFPRLRVPRDRLLMGSSGFAFDDQAMIAHVTSPFTDKIAPYRSNPPTDPRTLSPSLSFLLSRFLHLPLSLFLVIFLQVRDLYPCGNMWRSRSLQGIQ